MAKGTVLHINHTSFAGPGRVVSTIYGALEDLGYNNLFCYVRGDESKKSVKLSKYQYYFSRVLSKIFAYTSTSFIKIEPEVFCLTNNKLLTEVDIKDVKIIILYWYKNTVSSYQVMNLALKSGAKVFIYLMDEAPLTGGCHYFYSCENYKTGCGNCPSFLWGNFKNDITRRNVIKDRKYFEKINTIILCPSTKSLKDSKSSFKFQNLEHRKLLIPVGTDYLVNRDKTEDRKSIGISDDFTYFLFGASYFSEPRKGMALLVQTLNKFYLKLTDEERDKICLLIIGDTTGFDLELFRFKRKVFGYVNHNELLKLYSAADILISSSVVDMGPMMVNEAVRSGLPVACFDIGISQDIVWTGKTGYRVTLKDTEALANSLIDFIKLSDKEKKEMSINCKLLGNDLLSERAFQENILNIFN